MELFFGNHGPNLSCNPTLAILGLMQMVEEDRRR